jgi:TfoX/Sxy family transcriptional regulator of competence genes
MPKELADRVRAALAGRTFSEKRMFGGVAFMLDGKMIASASKRGLLVRVGKDGQAAALKDPQAKLAVMGPGRPMSGYVRVAEAGLTDADLARWLDTGIAVVRGIGGKTTAAASGAHRRPAQRPRG